MSERHPRLTVAVVGGFAGADADRPAYDLLAQAVSGLMSVTGHPDGSPVRVGTSIVDMGTGMWTALAVMAALHRRDRDGRGSHVTTSLLDTAVSWMAYHLQGYFGTGEVPGPMGSGLGMIAPYEAFPAADGRVMIAAGSDAIFRRLCRALELDDLATDPRFAANPDRVADRADLAALLASRTRLQPAALLVSRLQQAGVPCAPIQDVAQVARDPQVAAGGMLRPIAAAPIDGYVDVALPARWDGARAPVRTPPPRAGEHTAEILAELGLTSDPVPDR